MKPVSKKSQKLIHLTIWMTIFLIPIYLASANIDDFDSRLLFGYFPRVLVFFIGFYLNYFFFIERLLLRKRFVEYFTINIILLGSLNIGLYFFDKHLVAPLVQDLEFIRKIHGISFGGRMLRDVGFGGVLVVGASIASKMSQKWFEDNAKFQELQAQQSEAELLQLKSQINPHFLFNTLNNIYSLVSIDQTKAQKAIHKLSNLLRYSLYDNSEQLVPLNKELDFMRNYIELMKLRMSDNVQLTVDIDEGSIEDKIAPLTFITIVENAFKHGISNTKSSFIDIQIHVQPRTKVVCKVENSCYPTETEDRSGSGIGIHNIVRRLEILYPDKHIFKAGVTTENTFLACIEIDLTNNNPKKKDKDENKMCGC
ncbi:histidine kinase [Bacteroidales bacterium OttesenSCG-928-C19]|nr:histidine kinase [Bacteroidales bacterium OttesenSCG-928-C19]